MSPFYLAVWICENEAPKQGRQKSHVWTLLMASDNLYSKGILRVKQVHVSKVHLSSCRMQFSSVVRNRCYKTPVLFTWSFLISSHKSHTASFVDDAPTILKVSVYVRQIFSIENRTVQSCRNSLVRKSACHEFWELSLGFNIYVKAGCDPEHLWPQFWAVETGESSEF